MDDVKLLMDSANNNNDIFKNNNKFPVVIGVGIMGIISRVMSEYTSSVIKYISAYDYNLIPDGELDKNHFEKYKKMLK